MHGVELFLGLHLGVGAHSVRLSECLVHRLFNGQRHPPMHVVFASGGNTLRHKPGPALRPFFAIDAACASLPALLCFRRR